MFISFWLKGILVGLAATMPLGPIGILVLQRTLSRSRPAGFYSGAGAAISDLIYASVTGFGMTLIIGIIRENELWFRIIGSVILLALGILIFFSHPERYELKKQKRRQSALKYIAGTFMLAFSNPYIIFWYLAVFSGFGITLSLNQFSAALFFLVGFLTGDIFWWFLLSWGANHFKSRFNIKILLWFNRIAGAGIIVVTLLFLFNTIIKEVSV